MRISTMSERFASFFMSASTYWTYFTNINQCTKIAKTKPGSCFLIHALNNYTSLGCKGLRGSVISRLWLRAVGFWSEGTSLWFRAQ